jgi:glycosyltransferase involved in cell wall biosynthesis
VFLLGPKFDDDKLQILNSSDILIHPTFNDCSPLVLIEAMQFGMPIISTNQGGIPDMVLDSFNGYILFDNTSLLLAKKMISFVDNRDLIHVMGQNSRLMYEDKFTIERFEHRMLNIFNNNLYDED